MKTDVAIIGGGPAGLSAAVNVIARGASCVVISGDIASNPLAKSPRVDNYLGMRGVSGLAMLQTMRAEAEEAGAVFLRGTALSVGKLKNGFMIAVGSEIVEARRVILATGVRAPKKLVGEEEHLGRGVSYCATCDGMLYRGKRAMIVGNADMLAEEAALLARIGVGVTVVGKTRPNALSEDIPFIKASALSVEDGDPISLVADGEALSCDVVFVLRNEQAMDTLVPGLQTDGRFVMTDRACRTNIDGLYAAGDCTGHPLQIAKAVSDGLIAAWTATDSLTE